MDLISQAFDFLMSQESSQSTDVASSSSANTSGYNSVDLGGVPIIIIFVVAGMIMVSIIAIAWGKK